MALKLYNTLSKKIEVFKPLNKNEVKIYTCGPTVYDRATIGNLRTYILADLLIRTLKFNDFKVNSVQNITDVGHLFGDRDAGEDKLASQAQKTGTTAWDIASSFTAQYFSDRKKLLLGEPSTWAYATKHIDEQITFIKNLESKNFTYTTSDGIYFNTSKLANYGKLAGLKLDSLTEGARVEINPEKRNPTDFALWKFSPQDKKRDMEWDSPWGVGFPGWHVECSTMSLKYLGEEFDIHTGGIDFIPLHHTNEIAQNEALTGKDGAHYWVHGEFLTVDGGRMGKSLGNGYNLDDLERKNFKPIDFKYLAYTTHYRQKQNFTWEALEASQNSLRRIVRTLSSYFKDYDFDLMAPPDFDMVNKFKSALNDDLNTPVALSVLHETLDSNNIEPDSKLATIVEMDKVLGLNLIDGAKERLSIPANIGDLELEREEARKAKDWAKSDEIRAKILALGYEVIDSEDGQEVFKK